MGKVYVLKMQESNRNFREKMYRIFPSIQIYLSLLCFLRTFPVLDGYPLEAEIEYQL